MAWGGTKSWVATDILADPAAELNRIEGNAKYVYDLLAPWTLIAAQTHKTDWAMTDYPTAAQTKNIDDNIAAFAAMLFLAFTVRNWTGIVQGDYRCLNEWEQTLLAAYPLATYGGDSVKYCGTFSAGEDGGIF